MKQDNRPFAVNRTPFLALACALAALLAGAGHALAADTNTVWLDTLNLSTMRQGWGKPQKNRSMREKPLSLAGKTYARGVGTHADSHYALNPGGAEQFLATVGLDDAANGPGSVVFQVIGDGKTLFESGVMRPNMQPQEIAVDIRGVNCLMLIVTDAGDGNSFDHADWAEARFVGPNAKPAPFVRKGGAPYLLTPKPGPQPHINGPKIYGARPGHPFLYRIPTQGQRPITFSADSLPAGLSLDAASGIVTGTTPAKGEYAITWRATNSAGGDSRAFKLVSGDTLSLTPSMGFNDWYAYYSHVSDKLMREAADTLVSSGMADAGYQYVNIDDCWMNAENNKDSKRNGPFRDGAGNIIPNVFFPDMKGLADYIHSKGLKAGLYTSPGPMTCAGFAGTFQHEAQDAKTFADWGFDFLKYDWCSYGKIASGDGSEDPAIPRNNTKATKVEVCAFPYRKMGALLEKQNRDMLYNLCQYGMADVWKWGAEVGGQSWRTSGDLGNELDRIFEVALKNCEHRDWQKPGAWNDPDYLQIGYIGGSGGTSKPCPLTPNEQYAFMSLWCLMASPLFYSGDMSKLDEFTLNILCNTEVIDVDQDPLGECAKVVLLDGEKFLMVKNLADGAKAVGLGNRGEFDGEVTAKWGQLGVSGSQRVRDLWRQKDLGAFKDTFQASVPARGMVLVRVEAAK